MQHQLEDLFEVMPLKLNTANDAIESAEAIVANIAGLDGQAFAIRCLDSSPAVVSLGILCEEMGFKFRWEGNKQPYLEYPEGDRRIYLYTRNHVPLLLNHLQRVTKDEAEDIACYECVTAALDSC